MLVSPRWVLQRGLHPRPRSVEAGRFFSTLIILNPFPCLTATSRETMRLEPVGTLELNYTRNTEVKLESTAQVYGDLEGRIDGPELKGSLRMTNLATSRPDGDYLPTLRGVLTGPDDKRMFVTMDGLSIIEEGTDPPVRVGLVAITFRTGNPDLQKWNHVLAVAEYRGKMMGNTWGLVGTIYRCLPGA